MEQKTTWQQLLADHRVWLGPLGMSLGFKDFVDIIVPEIIEEYENKVATFELWIEIQYKIATAMAKTWKCEQNEDIALSLASYKNKTAFLLVQGGTEEEYALQLRGLFIEEYEQMLGGGITIGDLYRQNPVAFFGPLLRKNERAVQ